jgi:leucyl aminopeptidase
VTAAVLLDAAPRPIPLVPVSAATLPAWLDLQDDTTRRWVTDNGFSGAASTWCAVPDAGGALARVLVGVADVPDVYALAHLPLALPVADYALADGAVALDPTRAALGFALGAYQFNRYRSPKRAPARLLLADGVDRLALRALAGASALVRDLINTPTEHMGPADLAATASGIATVHGGKFQEWVGEELLTANFPAIHAVGRASHRPPRLIQVTWGNPAHPQVAIVGKGVCFDTGGLDIKGAEFMRHMKKDMGGAAHAIALAELVMASRLPVRLNLLVPAVENAISGDAYRPGEVIRTRAGFHVEIDNTDAEGRVVLCDALTFAVQQRAELILDFATLTGAARIALGPDLPALFANRAELAADILASGITAQDPLWQLPLWAGYRPMLDSPIADFANAGPSRHAGAITAALYLERFVPADVPWAHVDVYSWNDADRPGRPRGGEAQGLRAFHHFLQQRYAA